jgi:hypothetical protein
MGDRGEGMGDRGEGMGDRGEGMGDRGEGMGDRGEGMGYGGEDTQQRATGRTQTRVTAFRTEPVWYSLYPVSQRGAPESGGQLAQDSEAGRYRVTALSWGNGNLLRRNRANRQHHRYVMLTSLI